MVSLVCESHHFTTKISPPFVPLASRVLNGPKPSSIPRSTIPLSILEAQGARMSLTSSSESVMASLLGDKPDNGSDRPFQDPFKQQRDLYTQFVISFALGLGAFLSFCVLRPKWTELYAARRKQRSSASRLPELPDSFFGWIPVLYRITDEEVLQSAGLDAYVVSGHFEE